jgi:hypothetical protein
MYVLNPYMMMILPIVQTNLLLSYNMADPLSYVSSSPTIIKDLSGNNYHGSISGATYVNDPTIGPYLNFVSGQCINTPLLPIIGYNGNAWSLCIWIAPAGTGGNILAQTNGSWMTPQIFSSSQIFRARVYNSSQMTYSYTIGNWYYLILTYNGSNTQSFYINGNLISTIGASYSPPSSNVYLNVGKDMSGAADNNGWWTGKMTAYHIYSRVLSLSEIQQNFNSGNTNSGGNNGKV